jgi:hypothetical protein
VFLHGNTKDQSALLLIKGLGIGVRSVSLVRILAPGLAISHLSCEGLARGRDRGRWQRGAMLLCDMGG